MIGATRVLRAFTVIRKTRDPWEIQVSHLVALHTALTVLFFGFFSSIFWCIRMHTYSVTLFHTKMTRCKKECAMKAEISRETGPMVANGNLRTTLDTKIHHKSQSIFPHRRQN